MYFLANTVCTGDFLKVIALIKFVFNVICIIVPIVLILLGAIDLFKAVTSQKDDAIKKQTSLLIKRVVAALIIFILPTIISIIMGWVGRGSTTTDSFASCWADTSADYKTLFTN